MVRMKIGIVSWQKRVAPVLDVATTLEIFQLKEEAILKQEEIKLKATLPWSKAREVKRTGISILICGALSKELWNYLLQENIEVVPFVAGEIKEVLTAFLNKKLYQQKFVMPGCCLQKRRKLMFGQGNNPKNSGRKGCGQGQGGGRQGGRGQGGGKGPGICVCPECNYQEVHERGVPCFEKRCPRCNTPLTRG
ncbi:MAG: hypothetical protein PWR24_124 [Desulfonauticus sp.]|nr:hypothetical protein [Desulfonauticus sp.]